MRLPRSLLPTCSRGVGTLIPVTPQPNYFLVKNKFSLMVLLFLMVMLVVVTTTITCGIPTTTSILDTLIDVV